MSLMSREYKQRFKNALAAIPQVSLNIEDTNSEGFRLF